MTSSRCSLSQIIPTSDLLQVDQALKAGEKPDQETTRYMVRVITYLRFENMEASNKIPRVRQITSLFLLTYTRSSLKQALATKNIAIVRSVLKAGAWLYGIEKNTLLYEDKRVERSVPCDADAPAHLDKRVEFGTEKEWESHLAKAEQACGGNCISDAQKTEDLEIIKIVNQYIFGKRSLLSE